MNEVEKSQCYSSLDRIVSSVRHFVNVNEHYLLFHEISRLRFASLEMTVAGKLRVSVQNGTRVE